MKNCAETLMCRDGSKPSQTVARRETNRARTEEQSEYLKAEGCPSLTRLFFSSF